jgi:hypothetical protein
MYERFGSQRWLHHDRDRTPGFRERRSVTVCIAGLCQWNYGTVAKPQWGFGAITASDRMITATDTKFEPNKLKVAYLTPHVLLLVAGDYALHSEAIYEMHKILPGNPNKTPQNIALLYGRQLQAIKHRQAEDIFLAPLGMNIDTFIAQQKDMSDIFTNRITNQMQEYRGEDVEALVVGAERDIAQIYAVDSKGMIFCSNDVGFAAIGIGAWHAKSRLMQLGYHNNLYFAQALAAIFSAKKIAQISPGVGEATDMHMVLKDGHFRLWDHVDKKVHELHTNFQTTVDALAVEMVQKLQKFIDEEAKKGTTDDQSQRSSTGSDTEANAGANAPATETARNDEAETKTVDYD